MARENVTRHTGFDRDPDICFDHIGSRMGAPQPQFLLRGDRVKDMVRMLGGMQAPHRFHYGRTTYSVVPSLSEIVLSPVQHSKRRIRNHRIAGLYAKLPHLIWIPG